MPRPEFIAWRFFCWRIRFCGRMCRGFYRIRYSWGRGARLCRRGVLLPFAPSWRRRPLPGRIDRLKYEQGVWSAIIPYSQYGFRSPDNLFGDFEAGELFARGAKTVPFAARGERPDPPAGARVRAKAVRPRGQDGEIDSGGRSADRLCEPAAEFEGRIAAGGV